MKALNLKSFIFACTLMAAWYCTDNIAVTSFGDIEEMSDRVYVIDLGPTDKLYIDNTGKIYDSNWNEYGVYVNGDIFKNGVVDPILVGVDTTNRPTAKIIDTSEGVKLVEYDNGTVTDTEGNGIGTIDNNGNVINDDGDIIAENTNSSTSNYHTYSSTYTQNSNNSNNNISSNGNNIPTPSSTSTNNGNCDGKCYDKASGKCVDYYENLKGPNQEQYAYDGTCHLNCWYDPTNNKCEGVGNVITIQSSNSQSNTSSSVQQQNNGPSLLPKVIGQEKEGYATRYWDSCKPHCAWEGKGGPVARTCHKDGSRAGTDEASACDGGPAGTCTDQTPQIINDTIAYAFAATPGNGNDCGKCYMLTFKGTGASATNTPTEDSHRSIKGKHLIVMSNNIGYDVSHNQFDLMIPGGGPGAYNGCGNMGLSCAGAQYGGFLTDCNYSKSCLIDMCNREYANNTSMKNGCLFLANWMNAANNPEVKFVEVECPSELTSKY